ncbi:MAG TPA: carboxylating nicotinate-nucleotide diphosphorylase [Tepidisphaeraceae bacterium]|nr:carboxylating nicotinate-nucleotide diphosphorylase [Tepidisphaeraceae bacterium]
MAGSQQDVKAPEVDLKALDALIDLAMSEDLDQRGDITTACAGLTGTVTARIEARAEGVFAGTAVLPRLLERTAPEVRLNRTSLIHDSKRLHPGQIVALIAGPVEQVLSAERTILNFMQRLCGVASLTRKFVEAVAGTRAKIYDTRKTLPGWRDLDKYAVRCGGGFNHRVGLYDAILAKDNHLATVPLDELAGFLRQLIDRANRLNPKPTFICIEADNLLMLERMLPVEGIDIILLDNFNPDQMRKAVAMRDAAGLHGKVELEASGGVNLNNVHDVAATGVERISVGALTHSSLILDMAIEIDQG